MIYSIYRMEFTQSVHFGQSTLENASMTFQADRLFSALCTEAIKIGEKHLNQLVEWCQNGSILISDGFPYKGDTYFLPKPLIHIDQRRQNEDIRLRKLYKKLEYLPVQDFNDYIKGRLSIENLPRPQFGTLSVKTSVFLQPEEDALPYRIRTFSFTKDCGLYIIIGCEEKSQLSLLEELLDMLSLSGIGGRRSSGSGRFELHKGQPPQDIMVSMEGEYPMYMTLSVSLPDVDETGSALQNASYLLTKRSGFVASDSYAPEFRRKRDSYAFQAGSCFKNRFSGQLCDVSMGGRHVVYRYLKPMFMGMTI